MLDLMGARTLADAPRTQARQRPDGIAQIFDDRRTTFATLDANQSRVANALVGLGLAPQARIGYLGKDSDHSFELLFGAFKANVVVVAVNWRLAGSPEIEYILNDAGWRALFVGAEY